MYINGCQVGFYRGDVKLLMDDIGALKPTVFPTVPRLLNRVYDKVHQFFHMITSRVNLTKIKDSVDEIAQEMLFSRMCSSTSEKCF